MTPRLFLVFFSLLISLVSSAQLTIIVTEIPANTPKNDPIHIAGNFQNWDPGSSLHILNEDTFAKTFSITLPVNTGALEFKFTRGDWTKVESNEEGQYLPNRTYTPSNADTIYLEILGWEDLDGNGNNESTAAENVSIITDSFYMSELNRYRRIWIYLPPDYENTSYSYPVLYMHDGQNVFDDKTSFIGEWKVDETLNALHEKGDSGIIVVAIDNGQSLRTSEYTPWVNSNYSTGDGGAYIDFIVDDLLPFINDKYRTLSDREHTGIMGSSLGGLISTYAGLEHADVFGLVGAFSPAYWINPEIFDLAEDGSLQNKMRIYQIAGTPEGESYIEQMFEMDEKLKGIGYSENDILTIEKVDGQHSEWFWAREFEAAYLWLYRNTSTNLAKPSPLSLDYTLFPNPTNNTVNIELNLKKESDVCLELTDINGSTIARIYEGTLGEGKQVISFNKMEIGISSGVYLCKLHLRKELHTLKLMITD